MSNFSTEAKVRLRFQLNDTTLVPSGLVTGCMDDAHDEILRFLEPEYDTSPAEDAVIVGETLLSGALVLQALASRDAFEQKQIAVGSQRVEEGRRFSALMTLASVTEKQAWYILEPYLKEAPVRSVLGASDSTAVLGEE